MNKQPQAEQQFTDVSEKRLRCISLQYEGLNAVEVPKGGQVLAVVAATHGDHAPVLTVLGERDAVDEPREFYVTRLPLPIGHKIHIGRYLGFVQDQGHAPLHVFEAQSY